MPVCYTPRLQGLARVQAKNRRMIQALKPTGALGRAIKDAVIRAHRYALIITHVWNGGLTGRNKGPGGWAGGGLRRSHRMEVTGTYGRVYIDPNAINDRGQRPAKYGVYEHARGGEHAFYSRVLSEHGREINRGIVRIVKAGL